MANTILDRILETKRKEVDSLVAAGMREEFLSVARDMPPARDFVGAVTKQSPRPVNLIAELKKASPSRGVIRADFDPAALARDYAAAGADALSVLTDEPYFMGALAYIGLARETADLPVLRKDFLVDPVQVWESRVAGADAVLLIAAALEPSLLADLRALAGELGMGVLLEVHDEAELEKVAGALPGAADGWVLGINNRNLATFEVDIETTLRLLPRVPAETAVVSESGIWSGEDVARLAGAGVRAVLVGESLMRSGDVVSAVEALMDTEVDGD